EEAKRKSESRNIAPPGADLLASINARSAPEPKPSVSPAEQLKKKLADLEAALKALRKDPGATDAGRTVQEAIQALRTEGSEPARELADRGREALAAVVKRETDGLKRLEAWLEEVYRFLGVARRKSWWKR
ncbi:MAG: hypothetical protein AB1758_36855, partial [Candidatus Eremiobacterota bacterium]